MLEKKYITFHKEPFFELARDLITVDSKVLDIGPGNGGFSKYCNRDDFYMLEGNMNSVESLKKNYAKVFYGQLPQLPFNNNFFDLIHCSHVIEHLSPQVFYDTIKEMDRCLSTKGYIVISTPLLWEGFYNDLSHIKPYNPKVFFNYLIKNKSSSRTRPKISETYSQIRLIYRYRETALTNNLLPTKKSIFLKLFFKIAEKLESIGLKKYEKTGYTIVLQKNE